MSHPDEGTIQMLLDGELDPAERVALEAHVRSCASCAARIDEARAFQQEADRLVEVLAVPARTTALPAPRRRGATIQVLAWAASIVLAVGLGYYGRGGLPNRPDESAKGEPSAQTPPEASGKTIAAQQAPATASPAPASPAPSGRRADSLATRGATAPDEHARGVAEPKPPSADALEREDRPSRDAAAPTAPTANAGQAKVTAEVPAEAAAADARREPVAGWRVIALEEAVRILGGQVRLIDGLSPERVETGPGTAVAGANPSAAVVRVIYASGTIVLDEQREEKAAPSAGWQVAGAIRYAVTGSVSPDSLRTLAARVH